MEQPLPGEDSDDPESLKFIDVLKNDSSQTSKPSPIEIHRELLQSEFGKTGVKILEFRFKNAFGEMAQAKTAETLGLSKSTVEKYDKRFREKGQLLVEVFMGFDKE